MSQVDINSLMKNKDWTAVEIAKSSGPPIVPQVEPYLGNADDVIRLLAVDCVAAAGGPKAPDLLMRALADKNEQVRGNAINGLHQQLPMGQEGALLLAWDKAKDPFVRQQIPMILGRMQAKQTTGPLNSRLQTDPRDEVRDGLTAGLSKLGDADARRRFGEQLRDARAKRVAVMIGYVQYIDEPWVLPLLLPVLQRREIAVDLSSHRKTLKRRGCDLAVDEVLRISKAKFSFVIDPAAQYGDAQIAEVTRYLEARARGAP
jgi:HEAT repeat protein